MAELLSIAPQIKWRQEFFSYWPVFEEFRSLYGPLGAPKVAGTILDSFEFRSLARTLSGCGRLICGPRNCLFRPHGLCLFTLVLAVLLLSLLLVWHQRRVSLKVTVQANFLFPEILFGFLNFHRRRVGNLLRAQRASLVYQLPNSYPLLCSFNGAEWGSRGGGSETRRRRRSPASLFFGYFFDSTKWQIGLTNRQDLQ